jgi:phosphatidate cytidylyltransferase
MTELTKRILIAVTGIPLLLGATWYGEWYFFSVVIIINTTAQWEFYRIHHNKNIFPQSLLGITTGIILLVGTQVENVFYTRWILLLALLIILASEMFRPYKNASVHIGITLLGVLYIPASLATFLYMRNHSLEYFPGKTNPGFYFIMSIFTAIWICDTFAYAFGKWLGRHKLFEKVSPKKTIEGGTAGLAGSILVFTVVKTLHIIPVTWAMVLLFGIAVGIFGQMGDLVESWFKRNAEVKDSSNILPGHGGMLDRFDSLLFAAPSLFLIIQLIQGYNI